MMEGESEREKDHFSLESILHSEKRKSGKTRRKRKDGPSQVCPGGHVTDHVMSCDLWYSQWRTHLR